LSSNLSIREGKNKSNFSIPHWLSLVTASGRVDQEEQAPGFVHNFKDLTVDEDTPIDFSAPFVGNPIPQVEWFKDGIPLIPSKRLQFTCDGLKVGIRGLCVTGILCNT
jgi:Immunoglobulin I-set domain.